MPDLVAFSPGHHRGWGRRMAEQKIEFAYIKSPLWRVVSATGAAVNGIGGPVAGMEIVMRFTMEWVDVEKESFLAEIDASKGTTTVKTPPTISVTPLTKLEEVAVKMPTEGIVGLITVLLGQFAHYTPQQRQKIRDAFTKLPTT